MICTEEIGAQFLSNTALVSIYGTSGPALAALAVDLAATVAGGYGGWRGLPMPSGPAVYLAADSNSRLARLLGEWRDARGVDEVPRLWVLPKPVNLLEPRNVGSLADAISRKVGRPALLVLDCLAYCFGGDERNPELMAKFARQLRRLHAQTGATVLTLHRTGTGAVRNSRNTAAPETLPGLVLELRGTAELCWPDGACSLEAA